jgi:hypothetical protein
MVRGSTGSTDSCKTQEYLAFAEDLVCAIRG